MQFKSFQQPQTTEYNFNCPQLLELLKACHENHNSFLSLVAVLVFLFVSPSPPFLGLSLLYALLLILCMVKTDCLHSCNPNRKMYQLSICCITNYSKI